MKKIWTKLAVIVMAAAMCLSMCIFGACAGEQGPKGDTGATGSTGAQGPQGETGAKGEDGTKWFTGKGLPTDQELDDAKVGDFYINLNTNTIYTKSETAWTLVVNINDTNNISKWDGTIPGWTKPNLSEEEIKKNRPVSYVVDEELHRIDLYNAEAFAWFAYRAVLGKEGFKDYTVNLYCDVDLDNRMWVPIGLGARSNAPRMAFRGTFNGNGHTIYNLNSQAFYESLRYGEYTENNTTKTGYYIAYNHKGEDGTVTPIKIPFQVKMAKAGSHEFNGTTFNFVEGDEFNYGLFAKTFNATIKNLNVKGVKLEMPEKVVDGAPNSLKTDSVGTIVGFAQGSITVENCTVGQFEHDDSVGYIKNCNTVGGIIGRVYGGTNTDGNGLENAATDEYGRVIIKNCTNNLNILGSASVATGPVASVQAAGDDKAGGIVSMVQYFSNMVIEDCVNNGNIGTRRAGGIIAYNGIAKDNMPTATVRNCTNNGTLTARYRVGGIIGDRQNSGYKTMLTIQNCTNRGDIILVEAHTANNTDVAAGGLVGNYTVASLEKSLMVHSNNSGNVIVKDGTMAVNVCAGALIGKLDYKTKGSGANLVIGQMTLACGNNGDVIDMRASGSPITLRTGNVTNDDAAFAADCNTCIGYVSNFDSTIKNLVNVVYLVNIGARKTETPAA